MAALSLWARLDAAFAAAFRAQMGATADYLRLRDVAVSETWNPDKGPFPRLILYSTTARIGASEHGGGGVRRLEVLYPYIAVAIAQADSYDAARDDAQALFGRMLGVLAGGGAILQTAMAADPTSTDEARRIMHERSGASGIEIRGREGGNAGLWRGIAIIAWGVETRTGVGAGGA